MCCPLDSISPSTLEFFEISLVSEYILTHFEDLFHSRDELHEHTFLWSLLLLQQCSFWLGRVFFVSVYLVCYSHQSFHIVSASTACKPKAFSAPSSGRMLEMSLYFSGTQDQKSLLPIWRGQFPQKWSKGSCAML